MGTLRVCVCVCVPMHVYMSFQRVCVCFSSQAQAKTRHKVMGVLDIYGFEIFEVRVMALKGSDVVINSLLQKAPPCTNSFLEFFLFVFLFLLIHFTTLI